MKSSITLFILIAVAQVASAQGMFERNTQVSLNLNDSALSLSYEDNETAVELGSSRHFEKTFAISGGYKIVSFKQLYVAPGLAFSTSTDSKGFKGVGPSLLIGGEVSVKRMRLEYKTHFENQFNIGGSRNIFEMKNDIQIGFMPSQNVMIALGYSVQTFNQKESFDIMTETTTPGVEEFFQGPCINTEIHGVTFGAGILFSEQSKTIYTASIGIKLIDPWW